MDRVSSEGRAVVSGGMDASFVRNVLVIGTDARDPAQERGRSDSMILLSVNSRTRKIWLTSLMRDTYVEIPDYGYGKLNAAYSSGGAALLLDTIEQNYDISIDDYVIITFEACAAVIDAVGGVEVTLSDSEAEAVNDILISEINEIMGDAQDDDLLNGGGTMTLDGKQALSYSRVRYVGNADFERTERQRTVLTGVLKKVEQNPLRALSLFFSACPHLTTNLSAFSLYGYALRTPFQLALYGVEQQRIPTDDMFTGANIDGQSVLQVDFDAAKQLLRKTVYAS